MKHLKVMIMIDVSLMLAQRSWIQGLYDYMKIM